MTETLTVNVASWTNARLLPLLASCSIDSPAVPNLADAAAVRTWLRQLVAIGQQCRSFCRTPSAGRWSCSRRWSSRMRPGSALYGLIQYFMSMEHAASVSGDDVLVVAEEPEVERRLGHLGGAMAAEAARVSAVGSVWSAFDPTLILQIVAAIVALWKELRTS